MEILVNINIVMPVADPTLGLFKLKFHALGTQCEIQFQAESIKEAKEFQRSALNWIKEFEESWSRFKPESLLSKINRAAGIHPVEIPLEKNQEILNLCDYVYRLTDSINDPTSLPLTSLWEEFEKTGSLPDEARVDATMKLVSWERVVWDRNEIFLPEKGMAMEIGGFGKEYAVDQLIALAKRMGVNNLLVDLGRDLAVQGTPPQGSLWVVGIEDAVRENEILHRLAFTNRAMATSGNGRRFRLIGGKKFGHIIDPRTGWPAENGLLSATCVAGDCLTAGLFSTSACVLGPEAGLDEVICRFGVESLLQTRTRSLKSPNLHQYVIAS